ncbi:MAG: flagellar biosynthesis protein FliQ [Pyrinomonadaceae bacterium]
MLDVFTRIATEGLWLILILSLFPLLASLIVGLVVSLFQALTQIQEQTLTFVPKIIATILVIMITAPWMLKLLMAFGKLSFNLILEVNATQ